MDCKTHTLENPFKDCVHDELLDPLKEELKSGLIAKDLRKMCNRRFNFSEVRDRQLKEEFLHLYYQDGKSKRRTPCLKNFYTSRFVLRFPRLARTLLFIVFEKITKMT